MTPYDQERPDHTGRFKFDDTARKWFVRVCVIWTLFTLTIAVLIAAGIWKLAT